MGPIRVMHVIGGQTRSGMETAVLNLADAQRLAGHDVIITPLAGEAFIEEACDLGFTVEPLNKKRRYDFMAILRLLRIIKDLRIDVLHSHAVNGAFYASPAAQMAGVGAHVCTFHADTREALCDAYRREWPRDLAYRYYLWLTRWCRRLITVSKSLRENLIRDGVPADKIEYIPNGVDAAVFEAAASNRDHLRAEFGFPEDTTVIGCACRLAPVKNLSMLLRATELLLHDQLAVQVLVAGYGHERLSLEKLANDLGIAPHVHFVGWRDDVPDILAALDIYTLTSLSESVAICVIEAMAAGRPVVSTDVGGMSEIVKHDKTGLLVESNNVAQLADTICMLIRDRERARRLAKKGQAFVAKNFSKQNVQRKTDVLYQQMLTETEQKR